MISQEEHTGSTLREFQARMEASYHHSLQNLKKQHEEDLEKQEHKYMDLHAQFKLKEEELIGLL